MTPATSDGGERIDSLVRDIMQVPYSKHKAKKLIAAELERAKKEARANSQFYLMVELGMQLTPLLVHTHDENFPVMTKELLNKMSTWQDSKFHEAAGELGLEAAISQEKEVE